MTQYQPPCKISMPQKTGYLLQKKYITLKSKLTLKEKVVVVVGGGGGGGGGGREGVNRTKCKVFPP